MDIQSEKISCIQCGYRLKGAAKPICPECGRAFNLSDPATYRSRRSFYWRGVIVVALLMTPLALGLLAMIIYWIRTRF